MTTPNPAKKPLTDYRIMPVDVRGSRGALHREYWIVTGPYHRKMAAFTSRREAQDELTRLVNEAHASARAKEQVK